MEKEENTAATPEEQSPSEDSVSKQNKRIYTIKVILCIFLATMITVIGGASMFINSKLDLIDYQTYEDGWESPSSSDLYDDQYEYDDSEDLGEIELPEEDIYRDKNVFNILILGTDERAEQFSNTSRSDTIMVLSINKKKDTLKLISIERGIRVKLPNGRINILTHAFHFGGPEWMEETVRTHFNLDIDRYVRINFYVFKKIIDDVGGVDIELTRREARGVNEGRPSEHLMPSHTMVEGMNHMNGTEALIYCRLRKDDSDWWRIERQRKTLKAIQKECKDLSVSEMNDLMNDILPMIQTNLTKAEVASLLMDVPSLMKKDIEDMTIPAPGTHVGTDIVDYKENSRIIHEFFYD